jgi:hypothetical protein
MRPAFGWILAALIFAVGPRAPAEETAKTTSVAAGRSAPLEAAFQGFLDGQQRWAYTETYTSFEPDGRAQYVSEIQVDPSLPYDRQFVPLQINGHAPTEQEIKAWAKRGEELARRRHEAAAKLAGSSGAADFQIRLLNQDVTLLLDRASVTAEDETSLTYAIPLGLHGGPDAPAFDAFELTARVNKRTRQFESAAFRQRTMIRIAAGKHYDGLIEVEFAIPDARFPAVPVQVSRRSTNKPLFGPAHASHGLAARTGLRHVTPYDERFNVKLAPLKLLEF